MASTKDKQRSELRVSPQRGFQTIIHSPSIFSRSLMNSAVSDVLNYEHLQREVSSMAEVFLERNQQLA